MVRMAFYGAFAGFEPKGIVLFTDLHHIPYAVSKVGALFDNCSPCCPDGRAPGAINAGEYVLEGLHVFLVKRLIKHFVHMVGTGGALGIDIEHDKAVVAVAGRYAENGF